MRQYDHGGLHRLPDERSSHAPSMILLQEQVAYPPITARQDTSIQLRAPLRYVFPDTPSPPPFTRPLLALRFSPAEPISAGPATSPLPSRTTVSTWLNYSRWASYHSQITPFTHANYSTVCISEIPFPQFVSRLDYDRHNLSLITYKFH